MESIEATYNIQIASQTYVCLSHHYESPIWHYTISKNRGSEGLKKEKKTTLVEYVKKMQALAHLITHTITIKSCQNYIG
jgi:hypothetical protein